MIEDTVPKRYARPRAGIWQRYFEAGVTRPDRDSVFDFGCRAGAG